MVMPIVLKITKWILTLLVLLLVLTSVALFCLVSMPQLRKNLFPLSYSWGRYEMICNDMVISSADTMHLRGVDVSGPGFSIRGPDVKVSYSIFPVRFHSVTVSNPVMHLVAGSRGGQGGRFPVRTAEKILDVLRIEHGSLEYLFKGGVLKVSDIDLSPADACGPTCACRISRDTLCCGTCAFSAMFGKQVITGTARLSMQRDSAHLNIHSDDMVAILKGHPPICLCATVETGLASGDMGRFVGSIEVKDVLSVFPASMRSTGYFAKRLETAAPVPAKAHVVLHIREGASLGGELNIPEWFFPERVGLSMPVPANWSLDIDSTFRTGNFKAVVPRLHTSITGSFHVLHDRKVRWEAALSTDVKGFSLNLDDNHAVEGLGGGLKLWLTNVVRAGKVATGKLAWRLKVSWDRGEVLVYPWFFDLSQEKGNLKASGTFFRDSVYIRRADLRSFVLVSLKDVVLSINKLHDLPYDRAQHLLYGVRAPAGQISVTGPVDTIYDLFIREPFEAGHPVLNTVDPSGTLLLDVNDRGTEVRLNGHVAWRGRPVISGLKVDVLIPPEGQGCNPASLSWDRIEIPVMPVGQGDETASTGGTKADAAAKPQTEVSSLPHRVFSMGKGDLPLRACEDRIMFGSVTIPAGSGSIDIDSGQVKYDGGDVRLTGVSLSAIRVEHTLNGHTVAAVINGKDLNIRFEKGRFRVKGSVRAKVAGGEVVISHMWADISGPVPRYGADIEFKDIDLSVLTSLTGFGRITGRLEGHVQGLVMSGKQPESFDLVVRSRKVKGVDQKISIKAIRSLSILGGGSGGIPILGGFFKNFSYSKIAVSCSLKNDIFTMHGLITKGGTEYLVERGFWGGVNVINQNPGGRIAFSDMLERLNRISKSGKAEVE